MLVVAKGLFFLRVGSSAQPMEPNVIDEMYSRRTRNSLNKIIALRQSLTFEQLQIYYQSKGLTLNNKFAETLDLLTVDGKYNYIAYLLSDDNGVSIKVAKYAGIDKVDFIENEEYGYCSLIKATKSVLDKLEIENKTFAKITSKERIEKRLVEQLGSGMSRILKAYDKSVFDISDNFMVVKFAFAEKAAIKKRR